MDSWSDTSQPSTQDLATWMTTALPASTTPLKMRPWLMKFRLTCDVGFLVPIGVMGIIANVVAFVVLCRQKPHLTTNIILRALSLVDALFLLLSFMHPLQHLHLSFFPTLFVICYPFTYFVRLSGTWLTVLLTIDRFIAVCYPLHAQRLCHPKRTYTLMAVLLVSAFLFSFVRFFEFVINPDNFHGFEVTELTNDQHYTIIYRIVLFFIVMYLTPMTILVVLNCRLLMAMRRAISQQASLTSTRHTEDGSLTMHPMSRQANHSITLVVICVVTVSLLSNVAAMLSHVFWSLPLCFDGLGQQLEMPRRVISNISNILISLNSAINFIIYCLFSRNFRTTFLRTFDCRQGSVRNTRTSMTPHRTSTQTSYISMRKKSPVTLTAITRSGSKAVGKTNREEVGLMAR